jgi:hypothetical protein
MATTKTTPKTAPTKAITKVVLEPGMKIALEQNGVPLTAEQLNGENLVVTKAGDSLMVTMPDGSQTELVDFFITDDVTLEGDFWDLPADSGLVQTAGGVVAKPVALAQVADKGVLGEDAIATDAKATDIAEGVAEVVTETAPAVGAGGAGGVLAGVAGLGLAAGGGGDVGGGGGAVVDGNTFTLTAVAGPQSDNGAGTTVALYKASGVDAGQLLGTMSYDSVKGKYSFLDTTNFTGVIVAKLVDTDSTADYISEATGEATNFGEGTVLMSVAAINGTNGAVNLTISPLTTAAAKNLGVSATAESAVTFVNPLTGQTVVDTNKALAMAFNILDADGNPVDISTQTVNTTVNLDGAVNNSAVTGTDTASAYGRALALVANAEKASGLSLVDMAQSIALALKVDGSGAAVTGSLTKPSSQTDLVQQAISQGASLTQASGQMLDTQVTDLMKSTMSISMTMAVLSTPTNAADTYLNAQEPTVDLVINGTFTAGQTLKLFNGSTAMAFKVGATAVVGSTGYAIAETATSLTITVARADLTANATNLLTAQFSIGTGEATISNDLPLVVDTLINATNAKLTLDSTNAQLTAFAADGVTNNPAITAPNNAEAGAVVEYRVTKGADASGDWSTVYTAPVADGTADDTYKVEVRQIDKAGNISTPQAITFTLDSSKPATPNATFTDSTNGLSTDSVGHNADGITNNAAVTAPANVEAGARVEYRVTKGTGTPSPWSSTYTAPPANGTADGAYKVEVRQTDKAGNVSAVQTVNFTLDSTAPAVANAALTTDSGISTDGITNSGAITAPTTTTNAGPIEVGANVEYRVTKGAGAPSDWSAVYNAPAADGTADGVYKVEVRQTDKAGNASVQTVNFTLDTQATSAISFVGLTDQDVDSNYTVAPNQVISGNGAEAGATVQLFTTVGTGSPTAVVQTVAAADGSFNFILPTPASAGVQTFSLTYTDKAGNTSDSGATTAVNWGTTPIDTAPSQLNGLALSAATDSGVSQSDGITNIAGATLTGSGALNGATIEITATPKGGEAVILTTASPIEANSSGVWSYTLNSTDANSLTADTTFTVRQKAAGGTIWSPASPSYQVVFDNAAPAGVPTVVLSSNSDTFGANVGTNTDGITSSRTLILGGTAEANAYIDLLDNGVKIATLQADSAGAWTTTLSNVSAAKHNYTARQFDAVGNATAYSSATVVTVDVTAAAPTAAVLDAGSDTGALGDRITTVTTPKLSGTGAEPGALISVFDGANQTPLATTTVQANGSWSVTTSALTVGAHNLRIGQTDLAGNISALSAPLSLNIAAPITVATPSAPLLTAATDTGLSQTDQTTNATALVFTGTGAVAGGTVELWQGSVKLASVSTSAAGTWTVALTSSAIVLPESTTPHNIKARVIDGQGNISGFSAETPVTIDRTAPTSSLTLNDLSATDDSGRSNSDGIIQQTQPTISGSGASANAKVQIFNGTNTTPLATLTANDSGAFSGFVSLPAGSSHSLYAAQIDAAGNLGPKSNLLVVNVDNTAATAPVITTLLNDLAGNPMISGTAEANAFIELLVGTSVVGTGYADASGEWIVQWVQATADDYSLAARQTDVAGNVSNPSQAASATISGTNPAAAVVSAQLLAPTLKSGEDTHIVGDGITSKTAPTIVISGVDASITTTDVSTRLKVYDNGGLTALAGTFNSLDSGRWEFTPTDTLAASASGVSHSLSVTQTVGTSPESLLSAGLNMTVDNEAVAPTFVPDKSTFGFARYVMVYRAGYLQLGDVHVYVDGVNVALGRAGEGFAITGAQGVKNNVYANQSIASLTDGDTGIAPYSYALTKPIQWVQIDLGQVYNIDNIVVYPRYNNLKLSTKLTVLTSKTSMGSSGQDVVLADLQADPDVVWSAFPSVNTAYVGMESVNVPITKGYVTPLAEKNALSGTGEPGATVTLYDTVDGVKAQLGTALVASDGKWTVPFSGFTAGDHSLTFTQTDRAGNISPESSAQNITGLPPYPTSIPLAPTLTLLAADDTTSAGSISFAADNITSKTSVTIHGTGSHGETVQVFADLGGGNYNPLGTTNVALDGKWSLAGISLAVNGSTTLVAKSSNALGSSDFGDALTVTNNSTVPPAPTVGLAAAADTGVQGDKLTNTGLTDDFITLSGTAEAGALITIHSDTVQVNANNVYADDSGNWSSALTAGLTANAGNTFTVTVTNKVGVVNTTPVSYTVTHDDIAPVGTLAVTSSLKATLLPTVAGTGAEANAYVDIYAGTTLLGSTQASGTGSWSLQLTRLDAAGSYELSARHRDAAGNVQDGSTAFTLTVADDAPIVNNQSLILENVGLLSTDDTGTVGDNVTSLTTPRLTGNGAQAMANVQLWNGTELIGSTNADSTGAWVITPNVPLSAGLHELSVVQQGTGQNISPALPYTLYVASSLPAPTLDSSLFGGDGSITLEEATAGTATLNGTSVNGAAVNVTYTNTTGVSVVKAATVTNGADVATGATWVAPSLTPVELLTLGEGTITISATQTYGSVSSSPVTAQVTVAALPAPTTAITVDAGFTGDTLVNGVGDGVVSGNETPTFKGAATTDASVSVVVTNTITGASVTLDPVTAVDSEWSAALTADQRTALGGDGHALSITATQTLPSSAGISSATATVAIDTVAGSAPSAPVLAALDADNSTVSDSTTQGDNTTNATTPTFTGTANPGATVMLYNNGSTTPIGTGAADRITGIYTIKVTTPLNGSATGTLNNITAKQTDAAGNESAASTALSVTVDSTAVAPVLVAGVAPVAAAPTLKGTGEAGATVEIFDSAAVVAETNASGKIGSTVVNADGTWSFQATGIVSGSHTITTQQTDLAGNKSAPSNAYTFMVDSGVMGTPVLDAASDSGTVGDGITRVSTPTLKGTTLTSDGAVDIFDNGNKIATVTATGTNWTYTPSSSLQSGSHSITATDVAASKSSGVLSLSIDTAAAAPVITTLSAAQANTKSAPVITGTAEAGATITLTATPVGDGDVQTFTAVANASGSWSLNTGVTSGANTALVANKAYTVRASQTDTAGNTSATSAAQTFNYDTVAVAPIVNIASATVAQVFALSGTAEAGAQVRVFDGTALVGTTTASNTGTWTLSVKALDSTTALHAMSATQTDLAGNQSAATNFTRTVDVGQLSQALLATASDTGTVGDGITSVGAPQLIGTNVSALGTVQVFDTFGGTTLLLGSAVADANGAWALGLTKPLSDGNHVLQVKEVSSSGSVLRTSDNNTVRIDTATPVALSKPILDPLSDFGTSNSDGVTNITQGLIYSGTGAEAYATIKVFAGSNAVAVGTTQADSTGAWRVSTSGGLDANASTYVYATQTDLAGNTSMASAASQLTTDSTIGTPTISATTTQGNNPVLSGTAEALSTVRVTVGLTTATTQADGQGVWMVQLSLAPSELTTYTASVQATDVAGNVSLSGRGLFSVDPSRSAVSLPAALAAPSLAAGQDTGLSNTDGISTIAKPTLNGTDAQSGATVQLWANGVHVASTTASDVGAYSFAANDYTSVLNGTSQLTVVQVVGTGADSTSSPHSLGITWTVDSLVAFSNPALTSSVTDSYGTLYSTSVASGLKPTLAGKAEAGASVKLFDNGAELAAVTANALGEWTFAFSTLSAGKHSITTQVTDVAGNVSVLSSAYAFTTLSAALSEPVAQLKAGGDSGASATDGATNVAAQVFTGTVSVSAGQDAPSVNVYDNGNLLATVQADSSGQWLYAATFTQGGHLITARAKDLSGNLSAAITVAQLSIDTTAPNTPAQPMLASGQDSGSSSTDGITRFSQPVFTGTAQAGATVELFDNGALLGTAVAHATTGVYSISPSARLTQGAHSITVQAVDLAGNRSAASAANVITVDGVINPISFLSLASANVLYSSGGEVVTTSARPTVQGFGEAGATVTVFNNGTTVLGTTRVGPDGRWSLALDADLAANNSLTAQQTDTAGNTSAATAAMNVAYDSAATLPSLALQGSSDTGTLGDGITSRSTPTVTGSGAVHGDTVTLYNGTTVLGTGVADSTGKWTITVNTPLANNTAQNPTYTLTAKNTTQGDAALGSLKLKIDTQQDAAPTGLSLAADSDSGTLGDNTTNLTGPVVTGTGATAGATVRLLEGTTLLGQGVADSTGNWRVQSSTLTSGAHSLSAVQVDAAGNVSAASSPLVLVVDNSAATLNAPVLRASDDTGLVGDNLTSLSSVTVSGQGAEANAWVTVYDGSVSLARVQAAADGQWSAVLSNLAGNAAGKAYSLTARQTDTAGNISQAGAALVLMVENSAARPSLGLQNSASNDTGVLGDGRTQNNRPVLTGQAEAGASVQVLRDDGNGVTTLLATVLADASGNFTWQPTDELALGSYRYLTQATDVAGNVSILSAPFTLTIVPVTAISLRDVTGALSPQGGQLIDFNNDGLVDVVSQNAYLQTSTGIFVKGASTYVATGLGNESTFADTGSTGSVVDINGDGLNDIVTGSNRLFFTGSSGALIDANVYRATRWNKGHITVTDLLGDGQLSSVINGGVRIWVANGKQVGVSGDNTGDKMAAVYDANADGYLDVAFANGSLGVHLSRGDGSGIYQSTLANPGFGGNYSHITNLDLNNDGVLDVFSGAKIFQGLGNARYVEVTSDVGYVFDGNGDSSHVVIADINADGMQDILETNNFGSDVSIWINIDGVLQKVGNDTLFDRASNLTVHQFESTQLSAMDVNGDRSIDMAVIGPNSDISLTYNQTVVAENTYLRVKVAKSTGNETLSTGAMVTLYDSDTGAFVASRLVGNNVLGAYAARQGESYAEFFGLDPAKTYDVVVRYPGNDQGVTVVSGKSGLGTAGIASSALNEIVDSQLTAVTPGGKDVITVAPENRATATDGGNWKGTRYADLMVGDAGDDTFTPNGANAGEAGDTIDLSNGGHDKVVFNTVLNLNAATTISSFTLGSFTQADGNGDTINVSGLLTALGYTGARDVASLAWISGDPVKGMLKVDPGTDAADLMLRIYNGSGWQDLALITGADLTGKSVSDLIASGNLQLGQLSLGGTTPGITLGETGSGIRSALYSDVTVVADGGAFSKGFAQGSLKVTLGDAYAEDKLSLLSAGFVTVSGSDVHYKNVLIGTIDSTQNGAAGESLLVNFSFADTSLNNADQALAVQAVARVVQYQNTGNTPPDFYRDLTLQVSDGETSAKIVGQLTVTPVADTTLVAGESVVSGTNGVNVLTGTTGDDSVVGYGGPVALAGTASATGDTLTGNGGQDTFVYRKGNVGKDTITDFTLGTTGNADADKLNFADLLQGYDPTNIADFVRLEADATTGQVSVKVDYNGKADGSVFTHYLQVDLNGVTLAASDTAYGTTQTDLDALRAAMMSNGQLILA